MRTNHEPLPLLVSTSVSTDDFWVPLCPISTNTHLADAKLPGQICIYLYGSCALCTYPSRCSSRLSNACLTLCFRRSFKWALILRLNLSDQSQPAAHSSSSANLSTSNEPESPPKDPHTRSSSLPVMPLPGPSIWEREPLGTEPAEPLCGCCSARSCLMRPRAQNWDP